MKKLILQLVFGFIVLPALVAGTLVYLNKNGTFDITKIELVIEGSLAHQESYLKPKVIELEEALAKYKGTSLWSIRLKEISKVASGKNWIENIQVKRSWPSTLSIYVRPYEVKLLYLAKNGSLLPVIKDGSFLHPIESQQAPDVIILDGEEFLKKTDLRKKAVDVVDQIPAEGSFSKKTISEIHFHDQEGFWMTMIKSGIQVKMGLDHVPLKAARVSQVVDYLESRQFDARVIDANLSKKVLVRLRKGP